MTVGQLILEGISYGLLLTVMIGPIVIALTQTGIEKGLRAGILVGLGIWISDALIIWTMYRLIGLLSESVLQDSFKLNLGVIGGSIFIVMGIFSILKKSPSLSNVTSFSAASMLGYILKGLIVNTINPFTFVFWATLMTGYVIINQLTSWQVLIFFGTIVTTIMATDILKVFLAKKIRQSLTPRHLAIGSRIGGLAFVLLGIVLIIRVLL